LSRSPEEDDVWTIAKVLAWASDDLRGKGSDAPRLDAELLLGVVLNTDRIGLIREATRPLEKAELARYRALHVRRRNGEPTAYLRGFREFFGRNFVVDARVLIPRPDTETLVNVALERTKGRHLSLRALDLCTGSGCVAISIACELPTAQIHATDISSGAIAVARENATRLGAVPWPAFSEGDLAASLSPELRFDLITANPPYIPAGEVDILPRHIRDFEPRLALDGGADGFDIIDRLIAETRDRLANHGVLAIEVGAGQAERTSRLMSERGFIDVVITKDYGGIERIVSGQRIAP
jgi:release factor glutamine methyltransferase